MPERKANSGKVETEGILYALLRAVVMVLDAKWS